MIELAAGIVVLAVGAPLALFAIWLIAGAAYGCALVVFYILYSPVLFLEWLSARVTQWRASKGKQS